MSRESQKWLGRIKFIKGEYPFGPIRRHLNEDNKLQDKGDQPGFRSPIRVTYYQNGRKHGVDVDVFGTLAYYFRGVLVPPKYVLDPKSLTYQEILSNPNTEIRRVGMEIYGFDRLIDDNHAKVKHQSKGQVLISVDIGDTDPMTIVKVLDGTPKIDGTRKEYFLQVPPTMKTVKEAIAWTFYKQENEYSPEKET